jgi:SAM-dependent methyltransferase
MTAPPPALFDRELRQRRLHRAARTLKNANFLRRRAAEDAADRLLTIVRHFRSAVEVGSCDDSFLSAVRQAGADERLGLIIRAAPNAALAAERPGQVIVADDEALPFAPASLDLVVSLLSLHWTNDLVGALVQIRRSLKPDGLFLGALLGGATLTELRQALMEAEAELTGGAGPRVSPFADVADGPALLQRAGFALPVADMDRFTVTYAHPLRLLADLRAMGETNALTDRPRRPLTRSVLGRACEIYIERFSNPDGRVRATFEIISLTGWAPHPDQQQPLKPGSAKARLADALGVRERRADFEE